MARTDYHYVPVRRHFYADIINRALYELIYPVKYRNHEDVSDYLLEVITTYNPDDFSQTIKWLVFPKYETHVIHFDADPRSLDALQRFVDLGDITPEQLEGLQEVVYLNRGNAINLYAQFADIPIWGLITKEWEQIEPIFIP